MLAQPAPAQTASIAAASATAISSNCARVAPYTGHVPKLYTSPEDP